MEISGQDGGVGRYTVPPCTTKRRTTTNLEKKISRTARISNCMEKSNNQGVKEETFIQTGRRGRDGQPGWRGLMARWWLAEQVVPHLCVDKLGGVTGE